MICPMVNTEAEARALAVRMAAACGRRLDDASPVVDATLPDGTRLTRQNCVTTDGKVWCRVSLAEKPSVSGYVSADYLEHIADFEIQYFQTAPDVILFC